MRTFIPSAIARDYGLALQWRTRAALTRSVLPPTAWEDGDKRTVVLLPGVWESWQFLRPIAEHLHAAGHPVVALPELGINAAPIPTSAAIVARALRERDLREVALVAHSKGGLIGKYVMVGAGQDAAARVDRLVAIATPFSGSSRAQWMLQPSLREFRPDNPTVRRLADAPQVNDRITSIYGAYDLHIPAGSALPGAHNVRVPYIGHFGVLTDPRVLTEVRAAVER